MPWSDPSDVVEDWDALWAKRRVIYAKDIRWAQFFYVLSITGIAILPGLVFKADILAPFALAALLVSAGVSRGMFGQFQASALQGAMSAALFLAAGAFHPLLPFAFLGHVVLPIAFSLWIDGLNDMK